MMSATLGVAQADYMALQRIIRVPVLMQGHASGGLPEGVQPGGPGWTCCDTSIKAWMPNHPVGQGLCGMPGMRRLRAPNYI